MTQKPLDEQPEEFDNSLREELGLPPITNESDAPPVNQTLIEKLVTHQPVSDKEREFVMDSIARFANWRTAYDQSVVEQYRKQSQPTPEP